MISYEYISRFKKMGFGMFIHFGLYSVLGKGEWYRAVNKMNPDEYNALINDFNIEKDWATKLVATAKQAGCKYITLTTRHHDGFSLFDTQGLNEFDAPHSPCGRDLIREFVDACNEQDIVPFFYHTLLDWHEPSYNDDFPKYIDYLESSLKILATNYGKVGGFWFDGKWDKPDADWQEDRIYGMLRKLQPEAMIINNTGLNALGETGHPQIDSVTFERGEPCRLLASGKPIAGEVCQGITDHWGYVEDDICTKSMNELIDLLVDCRKCDCNLLLNTGLRGDGTINPIEGELLRNMGKWIRKNHDIIYNAVPANISAENADIMTDGKYYYAFIKRVPMCFNTNVTRMMEAKRVVLSTDKKIVNAVWLDNDEPVRMLEDGTFFAWPFDYGTSLSTRIAKFELK